DTKGNDSNNELLVYNAINCSKNDCFVIITNTKNYDTKDDNTKYDDTRNE
ncbi:588_t:CDS:1, partial [Gigaspora margarita]